METVETEHVWSAPARVLWYGSLGVLFSAGLYMLSLVLYPEEYAHVSITNRELGAAGEVAQVFSIPMGRSWVWRPITREMERNAEVLLVLRAREKSDAWFQEQTVRYGDRIPDRIWHNRPILVMLDDLLLDPGVQMSVHGMDRYVGRAIGEFVAVVMMLAVGGFPVVFGSIEAFDRWFKERKRSGI